MPDRSFILFDTAVFGVVDEVDFTLFQVAEGGDATHIKAFTNSRGAGQLPSTEKFTVKHVEVFPNTNMIEADAAVWFCDGYLSLIINNQEVFRAPLAQVIGQPQLSGFYTQAAAATAAMISANGRGYTFEIPYEIPGGTPFSVVIHQGRVTAAAQAVVCALHGTLTTP